MALRLRRPSPNATGARSSSGLSSFSLCSMFYTAARLPGLAADFLHANIS